MRRQLKIVEQCYNNGKETIVLNPDLKGEEIQSELRKIVLNEIKRHNEYNQVNYDPLGVSPDTVEICKTDSFPSISLLLNKLNPDCPDKGKLDPELIQFFVYEFCSDVRQGVYIFRRHNKLKSLRRGFFASFMNNSQLEKIESSQLLGIDDAIDLIIFKDEVAIFNHVAFERIFDIKHEFLKSAINILENSNLSTHVKNYKRFYEDLLSNMNYVRRVSKLDTNKSFEFTVEMEKTKKVVERFELNIIIGEDDKFVYGDKSQLGDYVNLMQDAYYETLIGGVDGIDSRR